MEITTKVAVCRNCPYYWVSMDGMECGHPYWKDKGPYDNMIITQQNVRTIPKECPLRHSPVVHTIEL